MAQEALREAKLWLKVAIEETKRSKKRSWESPNDQTDGISMRSPLSTVLTSLFMGYYE